MDLCRSSSNSTNEHEWEYDGTHQGEEWERCRRCGDVRLARYHDVGSGG